MRLFRSSFCLSIAAALLGGCITRTGIVETDPGVYLVTDQSAAASDGVENTKANALRDAEVFCADKQKKVELLSSEQPRRVYFFGVAPVRLRFSCVADQGHPGTDRRAF